MPRKKKRPMELTTEEALRRIFPKPVVKELENLAHAGEESDSEPPSEDNDN